MRDPVQDAADSAYAQGWRHGYDEGLSPRTGDVIAYFLIMVIFGGLVGGFLARVF